MKKIVVILALVTSCIMLKAQSSGTSECFMGDCKDGFGTYKWANGDKYIGEWEKGERSGSGIYIYDEGDMYIGEFHYNKRNGYGIFIWESGGKYEGEWYDGSQNGKGTYYKKDGSSEYGKWKDGKIDEVITKNKTTEKEKPGCLFGKCTDGFGVYLWESGAKYCGEWENGKRLGAGMYLYSDGGFYIGQFGGDIISGIGLYTWSKTESYEGYWKDGNMEGYGTYTKDGVDKTGYWAAGKYVSASTPATTTTTTATTATTTKTDANKTGSLSAALNAASKKTVTTTDANKSATTSGAAKNTAISAKTTTVASTKTEKTLTDSIKLYVEEKINTWQVKGEFEKSADFKTRVNETTRAEKIKEYQSEALKILKKKYTDRITYKNIVLGTYDADNESFLMTSPEFGEFVVSVPIADAPAFKQNFSAFKYQNPDFVIKDNKWVISYIEMTDAAKTKKYTFDSKTAATYELTEIQYTFDDIAVDVEDDSPTASAKKSVSTITVGKPDVDMDIPVNTVVKTNTYALIIGNEDYSKYQTGLNTEANVDFAVSDAKIFKEYCAKTLGIPEKQIKLLTNATSGQMSQGIAWLCNLAKVDAGKAELIFYYSGHGLPDEATKEGYLIPVDISGSNVTQGIKLADVYSKLAENPSSKVTVFLDACFSGGARNQSLVALKGVKTKPKTDVITGNLVVVTSSSGEESSQVYKDKQHGFMTYYLLKKLQETKGDVTLSDLGNYVVENVKKETALIGKIQTPQILKSSDVEGKWESWKLK